tara:strand:- start:248 stop:457 length:210 start_codon:yes stop_codon:yes gene_type:complete
VKFILVLKICSSLDGTCIPEKTIGVYDSYFACSRQGTVETLILLDKMGEDLVNKNKLFVPFSCKPGTST